MTNILTSNNIKSLEAMANNAKPILLMVLSSHRAQTKKIKQLEAAIKTYQDTLAVTK